MVMSSMHMLLSQVNSLLSLSLSGQMMMAAGQRGPGAQPPGMPQVSSVMEDEILMDLIWVWTQKDYIPPATSIFSFIMVADWEM